jgi:hypothetical protein
MTSGDGLVAILEGAKLADSEVTPQGMVQWG